MTFGELPIYTTSVCHPCSGCCTFTCELWLAQHGITGGSTAVSSSSDSGRSDGMQAMVGSILYCLTCGGSHDRVAAVPLATAAVDCLMSMLLLAYALYDSGGWVCVASVHALFRTVAFQSS